jgi:dihydropyrimidinase
MTHKLLEAGRGDLSSYALSRPIVSEEVAVARAIAMAEMTGAALYVVHVSSARALGLIKRARVRGLPVFAETRPIYLFFTSEAFRREDAGLYVGNPPLRSQADLTSLWQALRGGDISSCASDHAPWTRAEKLEPGLTVATARPGMPELETLMPILYSEGVRKRRLSLSEFVAITSANAAKIFGMFPMKGTIAPGSDADLVVWDPRYTRTVHANEAISKAGFTLYEGWELTGWPRYTVSRGRVVYEDGVVVDGLSAGRLVQRRPAADLQGASAGF